MNPALLVLGVGGGLVALKKAKKRIASGQASKLGKPGVPGPAGGIGGTIFNTGQTTGQPIQHPWAPSQEAYPSTGTIGGGPIMVLSGVDLRAKDFQAGIVIFYPSLIWNYRVGNKYNPQGSVFKRVVNSTGVAAFSGTGGAFPIAQASEFGFPWSAKCVTSSMVTEARTSMAQGIFKTSYGLGLSGDKASVSGAFGAIGATGVKATGATLAGGTLTFAGASAATGVGAIAAGFVGILAALDVSGPVWNLPHELEDHDRRMQRTMPAYSYSEPVMIRGMSKTILKFSGTGSFTILEALDQLKG